MSFTPEWLDSQKRKLDKNGLLKIIMIEDLDKLDEWGGPATNHHPPTTVFTAGVVKLADALDLKSYGSKLQVNIRLI
ncbi:MAG TPA: hypothetical protein VGB01_01955 [candidate division Zixibacteria bacterium]|jgi:hypothetical protein